MKVPTNSTNAGLVADAGNCRVLTVFRRGSGSTFSEEEELRQTLDGVGLSSPRLRVAIKLSRDGISANVCTDISECFENVLFPCSSEKSFHWTAHIEHDPAPSLMGCESTLGSVADADLEESPHLVFYEVEVARKRRVESPSRRAAWASGWGRGSSARRNLGHPHVPLCATPREPLL